MSGEDFEALADSLETLAKARTLRARRYPNAFGREMLGYAEHEAGRAQLTRR